MVFKGLSNKFVCYVILVFPFAVFLGQIIGVYADPKLEGVAQELGLIAANCFFLIFVGTMLFIFKPSIFWRKSLSSTATYRNNWIAIFMALIAVMASLYNAYEIHAEFGFPLILIGGGEEIRLASPLNKYVNFFQSFWFVALPLVLLVRNRFLTFLLIGSVLVYSIYIGSRGSVLFLLFMIGIRMQFSGGRAAALVCLALALILMKGLQFNVSTVDYLLDLTTAQARVLNDYINANYETHWGWFTYVRLFGPILPGEHISLIDLQKTLLNNHFDGLYVASAYVYPYLDFGLAGVIFFQFFNFLLALIALRQAPYYPVTCSIVLFALTISFYDSMFNQLFYLILIAIGLVCDQLLRKEIKF